MAGQDPLALGSTAARLDGLDHPRVPNALSNPNPPNAAGSPNHTYPPDHPNGPNLANVPNYPNHTYPPDHPNIPNLASLASVVDPAFRRRCRYGLSYISLYRNCHGPT